MTKVRKCVTDALSFNANVVASSVRKSTFCLPKGGIESALILTLLTAI